MRLTRLHPTIKPVIIGTFLIAINLAAVVAALGRYRDPATVRGEGTRTNFAEYSQYRDGSLWKSRIDTGSGGRTKAVMLRPPSWPGLIVVWWPLAASLGVSLATAGVGLRRRREHARPDDHSRLADAQT